MPSIEKGGVEKNLFIVSNYLAKHRKNIKIITISKKFKKFFSSKINFITFNNNIFDYLSRRTKFFLALILLINEIIKNKNTIVFSFQANIYTIFLCKIFSIKCIIRSNSSPSGWSQNFLKIFLYKFFLKKAHRILVNSYEFKKELKSKFNVNSTCIYNPLNKKEIINKSKKKSKKIFKYNNKLKIINIGRCTDQKDQITLLKALKYLENKIDYEAKIIGEGNLRKYCEDFIKINKLGKKISFKNFVNNPYPLLKQADIFVLSSKYEGLPNALLEAITLKKFSISSSCPTGPKEILLFGKGGLLFDVGDYKQLAQKILLYRDKKININKMIDISYKNLNKFDYKKNLKKYLKIIDDVK